MDDNTTTTSPSVDEITTALRPVLADLSALLATDADGSAATPCTDFTVGELTEHVVQWVSAFAVGYADSEGRAPDASVIVVTDPAGQVSAAADQMFAALAAGAGDRPLDLGGQAMPGDMALSMILWEYQVHGWDLARATGRFWSPDDAGLELTLGFAPMMLTPDFQGVGKPFAARVEVADSAPALDRLVGLSGRDPRWSA